MRHRDATIDGVAYALALLIALFTLPAAYGQQPKFKVLYTFCSASNCTDGKTPYAGLTRDGDGNLYGTTVFGGAYGEGTIFKVDTTERSFFATETRFRVDACHETVLYSFGQNSADGAEPCAHLIRDAEGNMYGTTDDDGPNKAGTVFRIDSTGREALLYSFCSPGICATTGGEYPTGGLISDGAGNLFGVARYGGIYGAGTVFKLDNARHMTVLYSFCEDQDCADGGVPQASLIEDAEGNLYGTTTLGGANQAGTVFKVDPTGRETVLYSFCAFTDCPDGSYPYGGLIQDASGNLYGTTTYGGAHQKGTVFKLDSTGRETVLFSFAGGDGANPVADLIQDASGNLYGTTYYGGRSNGGAVFKLDSAGNETVLHSFCALHNCADGLFPYAGVIQDAAGNLYGTTSSGGAGAGTVFMLSGATTSPPRRPLIPPSAEPPCADCAQFPSPKN